jgi:hypothetical protein
LVSAIGLLVVNTNWREPFERRIGTDMKENNPKPSIDQFCRCCWSMTTTVARLEELLSKDAYMFYNKQDLTASAASGCLLCKWIMDSCSFWWPSWTNQEIDPLYIHLSNWQGPILLDDEDNRGAIEYLRENRITDLTVLSPHHKGVLLDVYSSEDSSYKIYTCTRANVTTR